MSKFLNQLEHYCSTSYFDVCPCINYSKNKMLVCQESTHYWKCYVNKDVDLQYHRIMIERTQSNRNRNGKPRAFSSLKQKLKGLRQSSLQSGISRKSIKSLYPMTPNFGSIKSNSFLNSKKHSRYEKEPQEYCRERRKNIFTQNNLKSSNDYIETEQSSRFYEIYGHKNQRKLLSRVRSDSNLVNLNEYMNQYTSLYTQKQKTRLLQTTIGNESLERSIDQTHKSQTTLQIDGSRNSDFALETQNKLKNRNQCFQKKEQTTQTEEVLVLDPQTHKMQQQQRKYLRDQFMNHYGLIHKKKL